jgi:hypothetical protein
MEHNKWRIMKYRPKLWIVLLGSILIIVMGLFPPWIYYIDDVTVSVREGAGRHFLFAPPDPLIMPTGDLPIPIEATVDNVRLLVECGVVVVLVIAWLYLVRWGARVRRHSVF